MAQKKYQAGKEPGYNRKVFLKVAKRVHHELKKKGLKPTWNESQKFTSEYLFPSFKGKLLSKIDNASIDSNLDLKLREKQREEKIYAPITEIVEICGSVFKVPNEDLISIEWWDIGNHRNIIPGDVKIRINGGQFGSTSIEKNNQLDYFQSGISEIVENIRKFTNNGSGPTWNGFRKNIPGKKDDGNNCNYFIDFVLDSEISIEEEYFEEEELLTPEEIEERNKSIKQMELSKKEKIKQREDLKKEREKLEKSKKRVRPKEAPKEEEPTKTIFNLEKALEQLWEEYKAGIYTVKEYKKEKNRLIKIAEKLNQ